MTTKYCTIHYRRLQRDNGQFPDITLREAISRSMDHNGVDGRPIQAYWRHRVAAVPNADDHFRFLNDFHQDGEVFFGNTCLYSPGKLQPLIEEAPEARVLDIAEERAPDGSEYLHGIAYWLAVGDHFLIVQHVSIQSKAMEEYLTWLLRDQTPTIQREHHVRLQSIFDRNLVGGDLGDIKSIEVGGLVPETVPPLAPLPDEIGRVVEYEAHEGLGGHLVRGFERARPVLEAVIGPMETNRLIESVPDEASLEVNVNIGYRAKKRKFSREFMSNLEAGLRNMPDGEVRVRSKSGTIVGNDARLQAVMPIRLVRANSNLLDNADALNQLRRVYQRFLEDGRIAD